MIRLLPKYSFKALFLFLVPPRMRLRNDESYEAARIVIFCFLFALVVSTLLTLRYIFMGIWPVVRIYGFIWIWNWVTFYLFIRTASIRVAANCLGLSIYLFTIVGSFYLGGIHGPGLIWLPSVLVLFGFLLPGWEVKVWVVFFLAHVFAMLYPEHFGIEIQSLLSEKQADLQRLFGIVGTAYFGLKMSSVIHEYIEQVRTREKEKLHQLEELNKHNTRLLRMLSHDISNSLALVQTSAELLKLDPRRQEKCLNNINTAVSNVIDLIGQLREQQAVLAGKKSLTLEPVNLVEVCQKAIWLLELPAQKKQIRVEFKDFGSTGGTSSAPILSYSNLKVWAEPVSCLNAVICNVLSNAIKFSGDGSQIQMALQDDLDGWLSLSISDQGVGIPADRIEDLFSVSMKTSTQGTHGESGTGFGMPLAKAYIESFGGKISVQSKSRSEFPDDHGTTFILKFRSA
jgi:signal transduction histidine kinase